MKQTNHPKLLSFHNDPAIKEKYLNRLYLHYKADEIIRSHESYESELGVPWILACLEDSIFEGLPNEKAKEFPIQFLEAIPVGVDLEPVWRKFMIWLLVDENEGVIRHAKTAETKQVIKDVAKAFKTAPREKWATVRRAAYAAAYATEYAVDADAYAVTATAYAVTATAYTADAAYANAADVAADAAADAATHAAAADAADAGIDARNRKYVV